MPCRADEAGIILPKVAFVAGGAVGCPGYGAASSTGRRVPMGAGAICLTHFGGGIEFVSVVSGGTGMGAVGGASSACGGGATGAGAAAV